jgi:adenosine 3'-phospho 5'-phosphosulfate transporter B2
LVGIYGIYGVLQEHIMTHEYEGGKFPSAMFLVVANRVVAITVVLVLMAFRDTGNMQWMPGAWSYAALPAATGLLGSWCQHSSLLYITFPAATVFKSSKIVPTMAMSTIMHGRSHSCKDYGVAIVVTLSVIGFFLSTEPESNSLPNHNKSFGILMMTVFLISDCLTCNAEKSINIKFPDFSSAQLMLAMSVYTLIVGLFAILLNDEVHSILQFLQHNPQALGHIFAFGCSSTAGQYLILHTIRTLGPVPCTVMMTLRQIISILLSSFLYNHPISWQAHACAGVAFVAILTKPIGKLVGWG